MDRPVGGEKIRFPAGQVYGGRSFQDALAAANSLGARMLAISTGLGRWISMMPCHLMAALSRPVWPTASPHG